MYWNIYWFYKYLYSIHIFNLATVTKLYKFHPSFVSGAELNVADAAFFNALVFLEAFFFAGLVFFTAFAFGAFAFGALDLAVFFSTFLSAFGVGAFLVAAFAKIKQKLMLSY